MVRIHDHYAPADFMVLDMGEEEDVLTQKYGNVINTQQARRICLMEQG